MDGIMTDDSDESFGVSSGTEYQMSSEVKYDIFLMFYDRTIGCVTRTENQHKNHQRFHSKFQ